MVNNYIVTREKEVCRFYALVWVIQERQVGLTVPNILGSRNSDVISGTGY